MLFLFRGRYSYVARAIVGAIILGIGFVITRGALLIALGALLLVWGVAGTLISLRVRNRDRTTGGGGTA